MHAHSHCILLHIVVLLIPFLRFTFLYSVLTNHVVWESETAKQYLKGDTAQATGRCKSSFTLMYLLIETLRKKGRHSPVRHSQLLTPASTSHECPAFRPRNSIVHHVLCTDGHIISLICHTAEVGIMISWISHPPVFLSLWICTHNKVAAVDNGHVHRSTRIAVFHLHPQLTSNPRGAI